MLEIPKYISEIKNLFGGLKNIPGLCKWKEYAARATLHKTNLGLPRRKCS